MIHGTGETQGFAMKPVHLNVRTNVVKKELIVPKVVWVTSVCLLRRTRAQAHTVNEYNEKFRGNGGYIWFDEKLA